MARITSAKLPFGAGGIPCTAGPTMSAAVMVPEAMPAAVYLGGTEVDVAGQGQGREATPFQSVGNRGSVRADGSVEIRRSLAVGGWDFAQPNHAGGDDRFVIGLRFG